MEYDPMRRPGIQITCKHYMKPDWKILRMNQPQPRGLKAGLWKDYSFEQRRDWLANNGYEDGNTYTCDDGKTYKMDSEFTKERISRRR